MDLSLREACANERTKLSKKIINLIKEMEKEPHAEENTEDTYGYITALSRAELEIEKLIKKVD